MFCRTIIGRVVLAVRVVVVAVRLRFLLLRGPVLLDVVVVDEVPIFLGFFLFLDFDRFADRVARGNPLEAIVPD